MSTKQIHPSVRESEMYCKKIVRACSNERFPHHTRNWWKAWHRTWIAKIEKQERENEK